jgi:hypothetical protein
VAASWRKDARDQMLLSIHAGFGGAMDVRKFLFDISRCTQSSEYLEPTICDSEWGGLFIVSLAVAIASMAVALLITGIWYHASDDRARAEPEIRVFILAFISGAVFSPLVLYVCLRIFA